MSTNEAVEALHASLTAPQRRAICFDWDYLDPDRGLLRSFISNHWQATRPAVRSAFFSAKQQALIHDVYTGLVDSAWYPRFMKQLRDDTLGHEWGTNQSIAFFEEPGTGTLQFVFSGRHTTLRAQAGGASPLAFGGPILYGHQATGYYERVNHPGNVFWDQAMAASTLAAMLEEPQLASAVVDRLPLESEIGFGAVHPGLDAAAMDGAQRAQLARVLSAVLAPLRASDRERAMQCLAAQGGIERCRISFARDGRMSTPHWDNWRLEGPAIVVHYQGFPHVHVWLHISESPDVVVNSRNGVYLYPEHDPLR
ncbi:MAG TPA: DUF3500 domain-containing protein [Usitatibacter sp.]|nr:DUF3500 domain-containing protein [Usitatibacter sp.]